MFASRHEKLNVLVITEDWCGDALTNLPVLARMVEGAPNVEMRVFLRDQNPDLMDQYLNRGLFRSIPVFVFFDEDMNEVARFIERPPKITEYMEQKQLELAAPAPRRARGRVAAVGGRGDPHAPRMNVAHFLETSARRGPDRPALVFGDRRLDATRSSIASPGEWRPASLGSGSGPASACASTSRTARSSSSPTTPARSSA